MGIHPVFRCIFLSLAFTFLQCSKNNFPTIRYDAPQQYTAQAPGNGILSLIDSIAGTITGATTEDQLAGIWYWIHDNMKYQIVQEETFRSFAELIRDKSYTGCASHSVVFGTVCRAKGIPTVWVKAADNAWIADYQKLQDRITYYTGYTYLECFVDNAWRLVDAYSGMLYDRYDPQNPHLPAQRYAYAKGADPYALVLDTKYELWRKDLQRTFTGFDVARLEINDLTGRDFLLKRFKGKYPSIGVKIQNTPDRQGVAVIQVKKDFPADKAGVLPGDLIVRIENEPLNDIFQLVDIIKHKGYGAAFTLTVRRDDKDLALPVTIPAPE
jgi:hypothetical protein